MAYPAVAREGCVYHQGGLVALVHRFSSFLFYGSLSRSLGISPATEGMLLHLTFRGLYFRRRTVRDHSLLFFTFVLYDIYFILPLLLFVIVCRACPSLIVARPGGGDGFLFRPLRIPFLSWAALESFCYGIGFGRLGRRPLFIILCI